MTHSDVYRAIDASGLSGVYLLTAEPVARTFAQVVAVVEQALKAGVRVVQYRDKTAGGQEQLARACELVALAHEAGALLIVNDSVQLAAACGADGVHLGATDGDIAAARKALPDRLLGVSCYNDLENARRAVAAGADAIAFGSVFPSRTKPAAVRAPLSLLTQARALWPERRIVAIGGIDAGNMAAVVRAGAHAAAVVDCVFSAADPAAAARDLVRRFDQERPKETAR